MKHIRTKYNSLDKINNTDLVVDFGDESCRETDGRSLPVMPLFYGLGKKTYKDSSSNLGPCYTDLYTRQLIALGCNVAPVFNFINYVLLETPTVPQLV
jgi:hypothetical protein